MRWSSPASSHHYVIKKETIVKKLILILFFVLAVTVTYSFAADDIAQFRSCKYCGMHRDMFNFSRTLIEYSDGKAEGFCSIHCAAVDLAVNIDRDPIKMLVGDYGTKELVDAETAFWVIGGSKPGVMTKRAKWAFKSQADADKFVKEFGGAPAPFDTAMKATYEDMYQDSKMIRERRAMKRKAMEQGKPMEQKH
jgi:copper chaperone NosL